MNIQGFHGLRETAGAARDLVRCSSHRCIPRRPPRGPACHPVCASAPPQVGAGSSRVGYNMAESRHAARGRQHSNSNPARRPSGPRSSPARRAQSAGTPDSTGECPGFWYVENFLSSDDAKRVCELERKLRKKARKDHSYASGRLSAMVPAASKVYAIFTGSGVRDAVRKVTGQEGLQAGDYPVEYRVYPPGARMDWHKDDLMYAEPQYELVYTISNTTDSQTEWKDANGDIQSHWAAPNSLILIKAAGVDHRVTRVEQGERSIIKCLYTTTFAKTDLFAQAMESATWRR